MGFKRLRTDLDPKVLRSLVGIEQDFCNVEEVFCCSLLMGAVNILKRLGSRSI